LLWRANRRRLQPEALRDGMLAAAGLLDLAPMKSSVWYLGDQATGVGNNVRRRTDFHCRSVYLPVIRNDLPELFQVFDFADPHATSGARPQTTVAPQALYLLNDPLVMEAADATARRLFECESACDPEARVDRMYELVFGNGATDDERRAVLKFVEQIEQRLTMDGDAEPSLHAWTLACHALFGTSRFQFLD
jgi:hypothetical protein